jgi:hypothetical protein
MKTSATLLLGSLLLFTACEKEAGEGGTSSIRGSVSVKDYNGTFPIMNSQYAGSGEDVYIIYGDNIAVGDKVEANHEGKFEFTNLREGRYTIFVPSKDSTEILSGNQNAKESAVVREVTISKKKETVEVPTITVYSYK